MDEIEIIAAIEQLERARTDEETKAALENAASVAPHSKLSDLVFYGERSRSHKEILEEVKYRERIWNEGGDIILKNYIKEQMMMVLNNKSLNDESIEKISAQTIIESL